MNKIYTSKIIEKKKITDNIYKISVKKPNNLDEIKPGQFFNIKAGEGDFPLLRRPISVGSTDNESITFYINKVGEGTKLICLKEVGEVVNFLGPLGNGFDLSIEAGRVLLLGGGIGVAPLLELTKALYLKPDIELHVILGYKDKPFLVEEFRKYTDKLTLVSENYEADYQGFVTEPLKETLKTSSFDYIFSCGPKPMLKVVKEQGNKNNVPSQLLMEERMACGIGACLVCTCKIKKTGEDDYRNLRTCKDGPVFLGSEVIFDE